MRFLSRLFFLALIVLVVYNTWQINKLRTEVRLLKTEVASLKAGRDTGSKEPLQSLSLITKARQHIDQARKHILNGDFNRASDELETSLELLKRAGEEASAPTGEALVKARRTLSDTRAAVERLWKKLEKEPERPKGD
jgi:hypothetical protein